MTEKKDAKPKRGGFDPENFRGKTPWQALGVDRNAPPEEVLRVPKNAPRKKITDNSGRLRKKWNPDSHVFKNDGNLRHLAAEVTKLINDARAKLLGATPIAARPKSAQSRAEDAKPKKQGFDPQQYRGKTPWQALGVDRNAPPEEVLRVPKNAHRKRITDSSGRLRNKWHPDKHGFKDDLELQHLATEVTKLINNARAEMLELIEAARPKSAAAQKSAPERQGPIATEREELEDVSEGYKPDEIRLKRGQPPHRRTFATSRGAKVPSLLRMQKSSYRDFLQLPVAAKSGYEGKRREVANFEQGARELQGLEKAFRDVFPMVSGSGVVSLEFVRYVLFEPEYGELECKQRNLTYHSKIHADINMVVLDKRGGDIKYVKEERVYLGDIPRMTENGSFIVNGTERVVVSQMHRSPGVFFDHDGGRATGKYLYNAKVIPYHGRWLDLEFDKKDLLYFRIDRRAKKPVTVLLKAVGYNEADILDAFYDYEVFTLDHKGGAAARIGEAPKDTPKDKPAAELPVKITYQLRPEFIRNVTLPFDIKSERGAVLVPKNQRVKKSDIKKIQEGAPVEHVVPAAFLTGTGRRLACDVVAADGEVLARINSEVTDEMLDKFCKAGITEVRTLYFNELDCGPYISKTLEEEERQAQGHRMTCEEARVAIYRLLRPGEPPNREMVNTHMNAIFASADTYNLSDVGRMKFNWRMDESRPTMEYRLLITKQSGREREKVPVLVNAGICKDDDESREFLRDVADFGPRAIRENMRKEDAEKLKAAVDKHSNGKVICEVQPQTTLSQADILSVVKKIVDIKNGKDATDDIDSLANRRIRRVGEFVENYFRQGLVRVERAIRDRLSRADVEGLMPKDLISAKAVSASVAEFFNGNQLSQFMDQTNPLSEITHKRRVSAFGAGGLNRERVGFEVRDVHRTHYGRLCPIETPEGQNIGLINSMSNFADINRYGFLETPYRVVKNGRVSDEIVHLSAIKEQGKIIAPAKAKQDGGGRFTEEFVAARRDGEFILAAPADIDYQDIAPAQMASIAASMIPFLEHDDANRALMGSNMQRQAVPCLRPQRPFVGTGVEAQIAADAGSVLRASRGGKVVYADADLVAVDSPEDELARPDLYHLTKHTRTNQNTDVNQRPAVRQGDTVLKGDVIADGSCSEDGDLALGQNLLVAFMPWNGFNFEDSILISERVVAEDRFSSIHIIEEVAHARSTQLGSEEITRDIPHQHESMLEWLDDEGIVQVGVTVKPGDILVGKVTPKGEHQLTPEEKLLRAVFGEKASDVKDNSLRMPPGSEGVVIDVKVYTSDELTGEKKAVNGGGEGEDRESGILQSEMETFQRNAALELKVREQAGAARIRKAARDKKAAAAVAPEKGDDKSAKVKRGETLTRSLLSSLTLEQLMTLRTNDDNANERIQKIGADINSLRKKQKDEAKAFHDKLHNAPDLPQGILKTVKVYVAIKRNLQAGDKMAGRHGNKGVVSKIVPVESMPYLADGTPVDIVLSPLGVPSRMNIGQILETHLGFAAKGLASKLEKMLRHETKKRAGALRAQVDKIYGGAVKARDMDDEEIVEFARKLAQKGVHFASPIFDGASEQDISSMLELADLPTSGQVTLYDGHSGEPFDKPVTVGYAYMMKLHHLVDEKMHARSTGPYSLVTQQPLGGKAQGGGQRFGEMEVWALEAYGAAYTLCEILTVKSDDVNYRSKMFEDITEGDFQLRSGTPESFNVLMQEIRAMGMDIDPD